VAEAVNSAKITNKKSTRKTKKKFNTPPASQPATK
jgi:hypothetical protein